MPGTLLNFLFFQYLPELWHIGINGTLFLKESTEQLDEKLFIPFSGLALVPSGNIIIEKPEDNLFFPSDKTFLILLILFDLVSDMGFKHNKAHPKKGISNSSLLIMLEHGIKSVCKKRDSHGPWWLETKIHGVEGIFSIPFILHLTPQIFFNDCKIK